MDPHHSTANSMIITILILPPMVVRPSVLPFGTTLSPDDLAYYLGKYFNNC